MALRRPSLMCTRSVSTWQPSRSAASSNFTRPTAFTPSFSSFKVRRTVLKGDLLDVVTSARPGRFRAPHGRRWRVPEATRLRKGVRVRPLRITESCDLLLAPPKIVSMSEDQFTRAAGVLAEMLADLAESSKGIPLQRMS